MEEPPSQLQLQLRVTDCRDSRIIGKIRDFLSSQVPAGNPSVMERRIRELFSSFETPTHLPYALMIQVAVQKLNERNGSTEEAISEFIRNEFQDLPWAHSRILGLHLGKLCQAKELFRTEKDRYMLMDDYYKFDEMKEKGRRGGRRRKKNRRGRNHRGGETLERIEGEERCFELHERENEEQNHLPELHGTGTNEPIKEEGKSEIGQLGVADEGHGLVFQGKGEAEMRQNENTDEGAQEAVMELNDKISSSEIMNTEPHMVGKQNPMVIKLRIQCVKQPDNLRCGETPKRTEGAERCNELQEHENEELNHFSELHGSGTDEMIEEQGKSEIGQLGVTKECHGQAIQGQGESETQQNEYTDECEKQIEATTKISRFCSDEISGYENLSALRGSPTIAENQCEDPPENLLAVAENQSLTQQSGATAEISRFCSDGISNNENLSASLGSPTIAENQCEDQPDNLLAVAENQSLTQQIEAATEISRSCSDEINNNENLSASLGILTVAVIPKEKLQISEQEQHQNEIPSVQKKFSGACELLEDQEGPIFHMETPCPSLPTPPDLPVDLTSDSQNCLTVPISTEFLEHTPSEGIELTPIKFLVQTSKCGTLETDLYAATEMSVSMTVHGHTQPQDDILGIPQGRVEEDTTFGDLEKHMPIPLCGEWQPNEKSFADYPEVSLFPSDGSIVDKKKPKYYKIKRQLQLRSQGQGRRRGRGRPPKLDRNPHQQKERLQLQDQTLNSVSFPRLEPSETSYALPAPDLPAAPNLQQLVDPTSEDSPDCITRERSELQLVLQMSWDRLIHGDWATTSPTMEASLSCMNDLEDKPQLHGNKRGPKRKLNLDGKTKLGHVEQQLPKRRRRGRPPNPVRTEDYSWSWEPVAPSNNGIDSEENPNFHNIAWPQDRAQVQEHSQNLADVNNPSWEQKQRMRHKRNSYADGGCQKQMVLPRSNCQVEARSCDGV